MKEQAKEVVQAPTMLVKKVDKTLDIFYRPHADDAGFDILALKDQKIWPFQTKKIPCNLQLAIDPGWYVVVTGRSGLASRGLLAHQGTIDSGYRGIVSAIITNLTFWPRKIRKGDRVAQIIIKKCERDVKIQEVYTLPASVRGESGFGSSGVQIPKEDS